MKPQPILLCSLALLIGILCESITLTFLLPQITLLLIDAIIPRWLYHDHT